MATPSQGPWVEIWKHSLLWIISRQAGLIVKLLMKLSGQITPNEKGVTDKYTYSWKTVDVTTAAKDASAGSSDSHSTAETLDEEQKRLLQKHLDFYVKLTDTFHVFALCILSQKFWLHVNMLI